MSSTNRFRNIISNCKQSNKEGLRYYHESYWVKGRKLVYTGKNSFERNYIHGRIHPTMHAEIDCMRKVMGKRGGQPKVARSLSFR